jgi:hypothetical protein
VELSSKVQNVVLGEPCRREAVKAAQGPDLRLLEWRLLGVESKMEWSSPANVRHRIMAKKKKEKEHLPAAYLGLSLAVFFAVG